MYPTPTVVQGVAVPVVPVLVQQGHPSESVRSSAGDPSAPAAVLSTAEAQQRLMALDRSWPAGLCSTIARCVESHPLRIMIVDNSGSMQSSDGNRLVAHQGTLRTVGCTRWEELREDVISVGAIAGALGARTDFHLLNPRPGFSAATLCAGSWEGIAPLGPPMDLSSLRTSLTRCEPGGTTPLTEAVMNVLSMIEPAVPALRGSGQQVAVLIATDGVPDDPQTFVQAMQALQRLPVWVVVRLCTDDDEVVGYWNELDAMLEAPLEVLDDVRGEAAEVVRHNAWLTYGPPLHLARLFGLPNKLFDALDEQTLLPSQIKAFIESLLGVTNLPEPEIDRGAFVGAVRRALAGAPRVFDPRTGRSQPWIETSRLERALRGGKGGGDHACALM